MVSKKGQILFCNKQFELLTTQRLGSKQVPTSIFKLTHNDETSTQKLKQLVEDTVKPPGLVNNSSNPSFAEKPGKIEIRLTKMARVNKPESGNKLDMSKTGTKSNIDVANETRTNIDKTFI